MIFRATLVLLACALAGLSSAAAASPATYQRSENFATKPDNWRFFHPIQFYGYQRTTHTGGKGEAGGLFQPKTYFNYYADTSLNGAMNRGNPITASGRLHFDALSDDPAYTNSTYVCHFSRGSNGFINTLGLALTGQDGTSVLATAILSFSDGTAFIGNAIKLPVSAADPFMTWTYSWTPTGGPQGLGSLTVQIGGPTGATSTIDLTSTSVGLDFALDSFGLFQPPFVAPNSNTFLQFEIGHLVYTAIVGGSPKLRVNGPRKIRTSTSAVDLVGTTTTTKGNRVTAVRYRIVDGNQVGRYRNATGTDRWTATVRVPKGSSHIEVLAVGDNGLSTTVSRRVQRTP